MNTIKINNIEVSKDELRKIISENPDLLKPVAKGSYFFPKHGEEYWYLDSLGNIYYEKNNADVTRTERILTGVYATEAEATHARNRRQAIVRCWKWAQENEPFEPDWSNLEQRKHFVIYNDFEKELVFSYSTYNAKFQNELPYFKSQEDTEKFIEANKEDLLLIFK